MQLYSALLYSTLLVITSNTSLVEMAAHARTHLLSLNRVAVRRIELYLAQALQVVFQVEVFLAAQAKVPAVVQPQP